jgi:hypothetical protein
MTNRPYDAVCALCGKTVQDQGAADAKRREWDALPPDLRAEQEKAFDRMREGVEAHLRWLRKHRVVHALIGAVALCLFMDGSVFFQLLWPIAIDLAVGAAAGLALNQLKGGTWRGVGVFVAAAVLTVILKIPFMNTGVFLEAIWLVSCFGVMFSAGTGYLMGMKLEFDHHDHIVTP